MDIARQKEIAQTVTAGKVVLGMVWRHDARLFGL